MISFGYSLSTISIGNSKLQNYVSVPDGILLCLICQNDNLQPSLLYKTEGEQKIINYTIHLSGEGAM
jgi:hypothetical protein